MEPKNEIINQAVIIESKTVTNKGKNCILPCYSRSYKGNCLALSIPIIVNTKSYGILGVIDFSTINDYLNQIKQGETGKIKLIDNKGTVINNGHYESRFDAKKLAEKMKHFKYGEFVSGEYIDENGNKYIKLTKIINSYGWLLSVRQNYDEIISRVNTLRMYLLLIIAVIFMITSFIGYFTANMLIKMLERSYKHRKELEMMVLQKEKMSSLGVITSGIAHELNNPLANALIYTQMLHEKLKERYPADDLSSMAIAEDEIKKCGAIIKNLMSFSRRSSIEMQDIDVNDTVKGIVNITDKYFKKNNISVSLNLQDNLPRAYCNESIIQQTIMNMFTNAVEAMKQGGELRIKTWHSATANMIKIDIQDNGIGIPEVLIGKVFEPFFSTKPYGERTGLGLYISYELLKKSSGNIRVISSTKDDMKENSKNTGTIFTIELPTQKNLRK